MNIDLIPESKMTTETRTYLKKRLDHFYNSTSNYTAFATTSDQHNCWIHLNNAVILRKQKENDKQITILEIGAGKSGFGEYLNKKDLRKFLNLMVPEYLIHLILLKKMQYP